MELVEGTQLYSRARHPGTLVVFSVYFAVTFVAGFASYSQSGLE